MSYPKSTNEFGIADYVVFIVFLIISCGIGIFFSLTGGKNKSTEEFLMGNRQLKVIPTAISMLVSYTSAILILGNPSEMYQNGTMYAMSSVGSILATIVSITIFLPIFYPLRLTSTYEYLELRFKSKAVCRLANVLFMVGQSVYMGIAMYAPSTAMEYVTGGRLRTEYAIILCGVVGTFYTSIGGMRAVIWSDVFQAFVMFAGILAIVIQGAIKVGGLGEAFAIADRGGRIEFNNVSTDLRERHTWFVLIFGLGFGWAGRCVSQSAVQRYSALPTINKARASVILDVCGGVLLNWSTCFAGIVVFAYYSFVGCDPIKAGYISNQNQIVPYFVLDMLNVPCIPGLFVASLFAGALSTISSSLSGMSAITWKDFLQTSIFKNVSDMKGAIITKVLVAVFGLIGTSMGFAATQLSGSVLQASLSFGGALGAPGLGLFILGVIFRHSNKYGAFIGAIMGLSISLWVNLGAYIYGKPKVSLPTNITNCVNATVANATVTSTDDLPPALDYLYSISYLWLPLFGATTTVILGLIISAITGPDYEVDERLVASWAKNFACFKNCGCCKDDLSYDLEMDTYESPKGHPNSAYNIEENLDSQQKNGQLNEKPTR